MPLKRFYRACLRDKLTFDEAGYVNATTLSKRF